jgi:glycerate kinase
VRIVVAPDKFKGTLSATDAARAMIAGARAARPSAETVAFPASDGGEGFLDALLWRVGGESHHVVTRGPLGHPVAAPLGYLPGDRVVVESARACGLGLVDVLDATSASSAGVGDLIRHALSDVDRIAGIVVGVGGTASTDGGTGAAAALGWRFLDSAGRDLPPGGGPLVRLHAIDGARVDDRVARVPIIAACDVVNPLIGPHGSAAVFGPQKGASPEEVDELARGLERLAGVVRRDLDVEVADARLGGAGGGLAAGLIAFFGARLTAGFDYLATETALAAEIAGADVVVTGEGRVDASTASGKVVSGVVRLAADAGARPIVVAGEIAPGARFESDDVVCVDLSSRFGARATSDAADCLTAAVADVVGAVAPR